MIRHNETIKNDGNTYVRTTDLQSRSIRDIYNNELYDDNGYTMYLSN